MTAFHRISRFFLLTAFVTLAVGFFNVAYAAYQTVELGSTITIGEFLYEDDYTASTVDCTISIYDPAGTLKVDTVTMSENANGWHYYSYAVGGAETAGVWPTYMSCGTALAGNLVKADKTFQVVAASTVASDVSSIKAVTDTINWSDISTIASNTATLVGEVGTGNIAAIKTSTDTINWSDVTGLVTSTGAIKAVTDTVNWTDVTAIKTKTDTILWTDVTAILTKTDTIDWADITNIKANVATLITEVGTGNIAAIKTNTDTINWSDISGIVTSTGAIKAVTDTIAWTDVAAIKLKTDTIDWTNVSDIQGGVTTLLTEVGTGNIAAIKTNTDTINWSDVTGLVTSTGAVKAVTDTVNWADVTAIKTNTDTIAWADVTAIKTNTDTIAWTDVTGIKTQTDTISWTDVAAIKAITDTINWADVTNVKTNVATLITEIGTNNISAIKTVTDTINWSDVTGLITTAGAIKLKTDTVAWSDVGAIKTKTDTIAWSDVTGLVTTAGAIKLKTDTINWSDIASIPANVWAYTSRSLTSFGTLVSDVWTDATAPIRRLTDSTLTGGGSLSTGAGAGGASGWYIVMSDASAVQTGHTYRARVETRNPDGDAAAPFAAPRVTLYDADRNVVVSDVAMTSIGTGIYEYTYSVSSGASQGVWETVVSTQVESGKTLTNNDYWQVAGSPAQVIINSVTATVTPNVSANLTVTNEGLAGYEYHYEWCVVSSVSNECGGGDDVYRGTGAKYINPGEDWNTNLTATVPTAGSYVFKVIVYFGTESSGSSRTFSVSAPATTGGGGGGGGGGGYTAPAPTVTPSGSACVGADFNHDAKVNSVDFSILLAFWKTKAPFANPCVDINGDAKVNSVDFSILLSQWGTAGTAFKKK